MNSFLIQDTYFDVFSSSSSILPLPLSFAPPPFPLFLPDYGTIRKVLSPLNLSTGSCLLEEIELFPPRKRQPIRSLLILHSRSELYVGVRDQVIKIPLKRCSYHKSREWARAQSNTINLNGNRQKQICTQSFKAPSFIRCFLSERARPVCLSGACAEILNPVNQLLPESLEVPTAALRLSVSLSSSCHHWTVRLLPRTHFCCCSCVCV